MNYQSLNLIHLINLKENNDLIKLNSVNSQNGSSRQSSINSVSSQQSLSSISSISSVSSFKSASYSNSNLLINSKCSQCKQKCNLKQKTPFILCPYQHLLCFICMINMFNKQQQQRKCKTCRSLLKWPTQATLTLDEYQEMTESQDIKDENQLFPCDFQINQTVQCFVYEQQTGQLEYIEEVKLWPSFKSKEPFQNNQKYVFHFNCKKLFLDRVTLGIVDQQIKDKLVLKFSEYALITSRGIYQDHYKQRSIQIIVKRILQRINSSMIQITLFLDNENHMMTIHLDGQIICEQKINSHEQNYLYFQYSYE